MTNPQDAVTASATHSPSSGPHSSSPEEGRFPAGTVLAGRYRILGMLGKGGMGEVYKAFDLILNQNVALKFLAVAQYGDAAQVRFRNEVRIARQVSHPNVCRVYDLGFVEGQHFLSMEYIDGEDLASLLRRIGRLPQDKAIEFTRKICAGLSAAHDRGVLHRDLKPANIMIDGRGHVRITDFDLAALEAEIPLSDLRSETPAYMSPEQKAGREVTARSDIYTLGLILHEMFTGKMRRDTQSTPTELIKDLDPMIERLILRCLEDDPKRRPQSALAVAMALPGADPISWILYVGVEPYARRYWPDSLISWSRFSQGRMRNPLVASHILIAVAVSAVFSYLLFPAFWMISPYTVNAALDRGLSDMGSVRPFVDSVTGGIVAALGYLTLLVLGRMLFRKRWAADLVAVLAFNAMAVATVFIGNLEQRLILVALLLIPSLTWIPLMRRFGFLTLLFVWALQLGMQNTPLTATGWLANRVIAIHLIPVVLAAWALWVILSAERQPDLAT